MTISSGLVRIAACCLALSAAACGGDDDKAAPTPEENEGGAPSIEVPAPALGPADCATKTSKVTLTQPEGADVWGGLVVVEFEVDGNRAQTFDLQVFDPSLGGWINSYFGYQSSGQRDDGTFFLVVQPQYNPANKDGEFKVRVRPSQQGCPIGEWTESNSFSASEPLKSTSWAAEFSGLQINGGIDLQRTPLQNELPLPSTRVTLADATFNVAFGPKGSLTQQLTATLQAEAGEPYEDCTLSLTFSGTYELTLRSYGNLSITLSPQELTSYEGTTCAFPSVDELLLAGEEFDGTLGSHVQYLNVDYTPTVYVTPGSPTWQNAFTRVFEQLARFMSYETDEERGDASGNVNPQDFTLTLE